MREGPVVAGSGEDFGADPDDFDGLFPVDPVVGAATEEEVVQPGRVGAVGVDLGMPAGGPFAVGLKVRHALPLAGASRGRRSGICGMVMLPPRQLSAVYASLVRCVNAPVEHGLSAIRTRGS